MNRDAQAQLILYLVALAFVVLVAVVVTGWAR